MPIFRAAQNSITIRKNTGVNVGTRGRLNLIEGSGATLTVADDAASNEVDITVTLTAAGSPAYTLTGVDADRVINVDSTTFNEALNVLGTVIQDLKTSGIFT